MNDKIYLVKQQGGSEPDKLCYDWEDAYIAAKKLANTHNAPAVIKEYELINTYIVEK